MATAHPSQTNPTHTYQNNGAYTAILTITDNNGATDITQMAVIVDRGATFNTTVESITSPVLNNYSDGDDDNLISATVSGTCANTGCEPLWCQTTPEDDCNDEDDSKHPGATETYDGIDNDYDIGIVNGSDKVA